ncbi:MAG: hypothetical protein KDG50_01465 [Chromatiales bacterium]|nr:hypothetical protein [Chromatiales bacterium]
MTVAITGVGVVSSLGIGFPAFSAALAQGRSSISHYDDPVNGRSRLAARIGDWAPVPPPPGTGLGNEIDPACQYALIAAREAATRARALERHADRDRIGVVVGCAVPGKIVDDAAYAKFYANPTRRVHPLSIPRIMPNAAPSLIAADLELGGTAYTVSSACTSSLHALMLGATLIETGLVDAAIVGGTEAPFAPGLMAGWDSIGVLSKTSCRPFAPDRDGTVLGEGAAMFVLESAHRIGHGAIATIAGYGATTGRGEVVTPDTAAETRAMRQALHAAGWSGEDVDYIESHGTGTWANDTSEADAIHATLGSGAAVWVPVGVLKSRIGHTLGAAGAFALAASLALARSPQWSGPEYEFDPALRLSPAGGQTIRPIDRSLVNAFGFGGANLTLAIRHGSGGN